jgi:hypothetical protein
MKRAKLPSAEFGPDVDPASIPVGFLCIVSGILTDTDGTPWVNAPWTITAISRGSPPVYIDGGPVVVMFGRLDATGAFNAYAPRTDFIQPAGTTLRLTVFPVTSAPAQVFDNIRLTAATADLGAMLSPVPALRIPAAPLVYAYTATEILSPRNGNGYVNTSSNTQYVYVGGLWVSLATPAADFPPAGIPVSTGSGWDDPSLPSGSFPTVYIENSATPTLNTKIITGATPIEGGGIVVTFAVPFLEGSFPAVTGIIISAAAAGSPIPTIWLLSAINTGFTMLCSDAASTDSIFWIAVGEI